MIRDTSITAYRTEIQPNLNERQAVVIEALATLKEASNKELSRHLNWEINRVTPRVNELVRKGIIAEGGKRKCRETGRMVHVWVLKHPRTLF